MKEKIRLFFSKMGGFFKNTFTWANIKTWPKWLWYKFCDFIQWRFGASLTVAVIGAWMASVGNVLGFVIFFMGVWFIVQEANR